MSLVVRMAAGGDVIDVLVITNRGHPETGEHPADDDLRLYSWEGFAGNRGEVEHRRGDGPYRLVAKVAQEAAKQARGT